MTIDDAVRSLAVEIMAICQARGLSDPKRSFIVELYRNSLDLVAPMIQRDGAAESFVDLAMATRE